MTDCEMMELRKWAWENARPTALNTQMAELQTVRLVRYAITGEFDEKFQPRPIPNDLRNAYEGGQNVE